MTIEIATGLTLPQDAAVQVYAFLGRRGSGKTYGAGRLVEQVHAAGAQVLILDPVGTWWGLRLAADGRKPGIPVPVFGGLHGDIPLAATAGKVVAELAAERGTSLVLDVSDFTGADQRRFVADFATEFFHAKKRHKSPVLVVMEEAQEFAPQQVHGDTARMVGAVERMIKLGRNYGIGVALVSQRPQAVNKDVLNLSEVLFAFQMTGPQERKTVEGWVKQKGAGERDIGDELPGLPIGTAMMWSPQWLQKFGKYKILPKRTFDASATPDASSQASHVVAPIDLAEVQAAMAATIEEAKAKDPVELRREVARLRTELEKRPTPAPAPKAKTETVPVISEADWKRAERLQEKLSDAHNAFSRAVDAVNDRLSKDQHAILSAILDLVTLARQAASAPAPRVPRVPAPSEWDQTFDVTVPRKPQDGATNGHARALGVAARRTRPSDDGSEPLSKCARALLRVLAQRGTVTDPQLATLSGYRRTSSTFEGGMSALRVRGLMEGPTGQRSITAAGKAAAGSVEPLPSGPELLTYWLSRLTKCEGAMLKAVYERGTISRPDLSETTGYRQTSSTFEGGMSGLRTLDLISGPQGGDLTIAEVFFE